MSKWDTYKFKSKKEKRVKEDPLCRVVPPLVARNPELLELLFSDINYRPSKDVTTDIRRLYRKLNTLLSEKFTC